MSSLAIEGNPEIDTTSSGNKPRETSVHENVLSTNTSNPSPAVQNDAYSESSETPTVWMWVLTFVAGISGVGSSWLAMWDLGADINVRNQVTFWI